MAETQPEEMPEAGSEQGADNIEEGSDEPKLATSSDDAKGEAKKSKMSSPKKLVTR